MSSDRPLQHETLIRAAAIAGAEVDYLVDGMAEVMATEEPFSNVVVFTDASVSSFGFEVDLPADDAWLPRRMSRLVAGISPSKALPRMAVARGGTLRIGYDSGTQGISGRGRFGNSAILEQRGPASLADDLEAVAAAALSPAACESIAGRLLGLTAGDDGLRERVVRTIAYTGDDAIATQIELGAQTQGDQIARLAEVAPALGLDSDHVGALGTVQDALIAIAPPWVRIAATPAAVQPGLTIAYAGQTVEHALRAIGRLSARPDAIATFGQLLATLGSDRITTIELVVRPHDPIAARIGIAVTE